MLLLVFLYVTSSHLTARLALLLCVDVDGCLVDTCECVVPWIVPGGLKYLGEKNQKQLNHFWGLLHKQCNHYLHGAVRPLLMADKVVGSQHHLADVTVKACFMPVLTEKQTSHIILQDL